MVPSPTDGAAKQELWRRWCRIFVTRFEWTNSHCEYDAHGEIKGMLCKIAALFDHAARLSLRLALAKCAL